MKFIEFAGPPGGGKTQLAQLLHNHTRRIGLRSIHAETLSLALQESGRFDLLGTFARSHPEVAKAIPELLGDVRSSKRKRLNQGMETWSALQIQAHRIDLGFVDEGLLQRNAHLAHTGGTLDRYLEVVRQQPVPDLIIYITIDFQQGLERAISRLPPERQAVRRRRLMPTLEVLPTIETAMRSALEIYRSRGVTVLELNGASPQIRNLRRAWRCMQDCDLVAKTSPRPPSPT
ncbi:hypothetical protein POI8812_00628 [Pontivivens insulae]|uniref:Uncharacterized protein n=1 Tax=Pontivivens insulae TaxID=1639689 RepID=A0A2R8A8G9_9RHOB|nr:hypothetical protein DFR53_0627 [Pontivivens insulae]SPF28330.1 hypothetical protein POI8812_00628 [Pontivivens insulae]